MFWCPTLFYNDAENLLKIENCKTGSVFGANFRHETTLWSEIVARARSQSHYMNKSHGESYLWNRIWIFWLVLGQLGLLKICEIKLSPNVSTNSRSWLTLISRWFRDWKGFLMIGWSAEKTFFFCFLNITKPCTRKMEENYTIR